MGGGRRALDHLPPELAIEAGEETSTTLESSSHSSSECDPRRHPFLDDEAQVEVARDEEEIARRRRCKTYLEVMKYYETSGVRAQGLHDAKIAIKSHKAGGYDIPETITLLLVGPRGSGKSSLVNRITRVFDEDPFSPYRAQVSHNLSVTDGSFFLQEYMIPRNSTSLCIYDTRSLSMVPSDNFKLLKRWMTQGVSHGEMIARDSDDDATRKKIKDMTRQGIFSPCQKRTVSFVIFVVDGVSVMKSMDNRERQYNDMIVETFNYPFLSLKDSKPVVVVTHGDELSHIDRARVRTHLGELLGIPPSQQIFDIPDTNDYATELAIVDMLWYSIDHASRNLPLKQNYLLEGQKLLLRMMDRLQGFDDWILILEVLIISLCIIVLLLRGSIKLMIW